MAEIKKTSDDPLELLGFAPAQQDIIPIIPTSPTPLGGNSKFSVEIIHSHIKSGGTIELIPIGSKAIVVRDKFDPAIQDLVSQLQAELGTIKGISTQEDATSANLSLKKAKQLIKTLAEQRKLMTSVLDDEKKRIMAVEDKIISELEAMTNAINGQITTFQNAELEKKRKIEATLKAERDEEIRKQQEEINRKAKIQNLILEFENNVLKGAAECTINTIDEKIKHFKTFKLNPEKYMEFMPEAEIMYQKCLTRLNERKTELMQLEQAYAANADMGKQLAQEQEQKNAFLLEAQEQKTENVNQALQDEKQEGIANAQMGYELKAAQTPEIKGVSTQWVFDADNIDMSLLPDEYKTFDDKKIKEAIKKGARNIPGIKIYDKLNNRSA